MQSYVLFHDEVTNKLVMRGLDELKGVFFEDGEGVYIIDFDPTDGEVKFSDASALTLDAEEVSDKVVFIFNQE